MNANLLVQAFLKGGVLGVVGAVVTYSYQSTQLKNCMANLPPLSPIDIQNFGKSVTESFERQSACPISPESSAIEAAVIVGLVGSVISFMWQQKKN